MMGYYGAYMMGYCEGLLYGSYEQVAIQDAMSRFLTAAGYCRK